MADRSVIDLLCTAAARGDLHAVINLLERGANVNGLNKFNRTALQVAMLGSSTVVTTLLEVGANPDTRDPVCSLTVTHDAAREGFVDTVRVLMEHGANINLEDTQGNLPLHLAAREGHLQVVQLLIGHTENPRAPNSQGFTAGELAHRHGKVETASYIGQYLSSN